jgi:hypothetical protein
MLIFDGEGEASGWARVPDPQILRIEGVPWLKQRHFIDVVVEHVALVQIFRAWSLLRVFKVQHVDVSRR